MSDKEEKNEEQKPGALTSRLLKARTVLITGPVDTEMAERVITQLLVLDAESHDPIRVIVTSQGGQVDSGFAIFDMLRYVESEVICIGAGYVASMAVAILFGAEKERRFALPNTRFLLHQPSAGAEGHLSDIRIEAQEILRIRSRLNDLIAAETGQPADKVAKDSDRDFWMGAEEAKEYGLVSKIVTSVKDLP